MTMFRTTKTLASAAIALGIAAAGALGPSGASRAADPQLVAVSEDQVALDLNKGRLVRLPAPAATVFVADPEIADIQVKSPRLVYLMGRKPGDTTLFAVDGRERVLANLNVRVNHNLSDLRRTISDLYPGLDISVSSVGDAIMLNGTVPTALIAEDLQRLTGHYAGTKKTAVTDGVTTTTTEEPMVINRLRVTAPNQVNLRVRVAEITRGVDKQLGINWDVIGTLGAFSFGLATTNPFTVNVTEHTAVADAVTGSWNVGAVLDALEEEGLVTVLAEPNLTAMSGETASFLAGGEFPIMVPQGTDRIIIEFKPFGIALAFTPTIVGDRISLHVAPEVSQLTTTGAITVPLAGGTLQIPALTTRRAETMVELGSGQSFAIAGLLQNNVTHDISKFPGLADVPVLGRLFQSDRFQRDESELVILVTPYIVKPVSAPRMASPLDGFHPPSDMERLVVGGTHKRDRTPGRPASVVGDGRSLIGPVGFTLD